MYCLPVLKRETHRLDLVKAATSGNPKFFLGTDTAPHAREAKLSACGETSAVTGQCFPFSRLFGRGLLLNVAYHHTESG